MKKILSLASVFAVLLLISCGHGSSTPTPFFDAIVTVDSGSNTTFYVTDYNQKVVQSSAAVTSGFDPASGSLSFSVFAGHSGTAGTGGGVGTNAYFNVLEGLSTDGTSLFVSDFQGFGNGSVRQINISTGAVSTSSAFVGGTASASLSADTQQSIGYTRGSVALSGNQLFVIDAANQGLVHFDYSTNPPTKVETIPFSVPAGQCASGNTNLTSNSSCAYGLASNSAGTIFFVTVNQTVQMIFKSPASNPFPTLCPAASTPPSGWNTCILAGTAATSVNSQNSATVDLFNYPTGIAYDQVGALYIADTQNHVIKKLTDSGLTLLSGILASPGLVDGGTSSAQFSYPVGVVWVASNTNACPSSYASGCLYVTDQSGQNIRFVDPATGNARKVY